MTPFFLYILSTGAIWVSDSVSFAPSGTVVASFRINPLGKAQLICTLTGSGNSSSSSLAATVATKSGTAEGNEIH